MRGHGARKRLQEPQEYTEETDDDIRSQESVDSEVYFNVQRSSWEAAVASQESEASAPSTQATEPDRDRFLNSHNNAANPIAVASPGTSAYSKKPSAKCETMNKNKVQLNTLQG